MNGKRIALSRSECEADIRSEQRALARGDLVTYVGTAIGTLVFTAIVIGISIASDMPIVLTVALAVCALSVCVYYGCTGLIPAIRTLRLLKTDRLVLTVDKICGKDQKAGRRYDVNLIHFTAHKSHRVTPELFRESRLGDEFYVFSFETDEKRTLKIYPASKYEIK